jgi:hypothetical protein
MPCTFTGSIEGDRAMFASERATELVDMLCRMMTIFEEKKLQELYASKYNEKLVIPKDIMEFWTEHKKVDAKRRKKEAEELKKSALAKLTPEERKILGV